MFEQNLEQCVWRTPSEETPENSGICQNNHIVDSCFDIFKSNYSTCLPESRKMLLDSTINVASKYLKYLCGNNATNYKKYQSEEVQNCSMIVRDKLDQYENDYKDYSDEFGDSFKFLDSWEETLEMYKNLEFIMSDFVRSRYCEAMAECEDKSDLEFIDEFFRIMREEFPIEGRTNPVHICPFDELNVK